MIILFAFKKGGTMKSTLACSMAAYLSANNKKVLLVDTDKGQYTSRNWAADREESEYTPAVPCITSANADGLTDTLQALEKQYDYVIVDGHGGDTPANRAAMIVADAVITPLSPTQADLDTLEPWLNIVKAAKLHNKKSLQLIAVLTQCANESMTKEGRDYMEEFPEYHLIKPWIKFRITWQKMPSGKGASEMLQRTNEPMRTEFLLVAQELMKVITNGSKKTR